MTHTIEPSSYEQQSLHLPRVKKKIVKSASLILLALSSIAIFTTTSRGGISHTLTWAGIIFFSILALAYVKHNETKATIFFLTSLALPTLALNIFDKGALASTYLAAPAIAAATVALLKFRIGVIVAGLYTLLFVISVTYFSTAHTEVFRNAYLSHVDNIGFYLGFTLIISCVMTCGLVVIIKKTYVQLQNELIQEKNDALKLRHQAEKLTTQLSNSLNQKTALLDMTSQMQRVGKIIGGVYFVEQDEMVRLNPYRQTYDIATLEEAAARHREAHGVESKAIELIKQALVNQQDWDKVVETTDRNGQTVHLQVKGKVIKSDDRVEKLVVVIHDVTEIKHLQQDLAHSQKLEAIGQLSAGIAHEINTPTQFVSDNLAFTKESVDELFSTLHSIEQQIAQADPNQLITKLDEIMNSDDLQYLREEMPLALEQSLDGLGRITTIVRAMKDYAHPGSDADFIDLNASIRSTVTVSQSEWKNHANIELDLAEDLPLVECVASDINQVVLNMVVNAAHAIGETTAGAGPTSGLINIRTTHLENTVRIIIKDNGKGIPEEIQNKIFNPFFTTKGVGKGTGQGLHIAHNIVVKKHSGNLSLNSVEGEGTCFTIELPITMVHKQENAA